ncbi:MAG: glycosyltransferase [Synergistaceae bacterium]|nr:glycosyltransferase [Synergistaceae bacterium]
MNMISETSASPSIGDDVVHVALSLYDPAGTYSRHAGVVIASILANTSNPVCFHILHDETLTVENRKKLEETYNGNVAECAGCQSPDVAGIHFVDMSDMETHNDVDLDEMGGIFSRGTIYRLCIPEVLNNIKSVIYLDCDLVVNLDIVDLWTKTTCGQDYILAGVREDNSSSEPDSTVPRELIKTNSAGLTLERYINAGVLIMNLEKLRDEYAEKGNLCVRAAEYIRRNKPQCPDQDFLNAEYIGRILFIDKMYNTVPVEDYEDVFNVKMIFHFFSKGKPWNLVRGSNADMLYWKYLTYTPWKEELIESFYKAATNDEFYHRHSNACISRLKKQLKNNIKNIKRIFRKSDSI